MADSAADLEAELTALYERHRLGLTSSDRVELLGLEARCGWRPGARPVRPERKISAFLDLLDRAEQQELTDRTLPTGSVDELRRLFRGRLVDG